MRQSSSDCPPRRGRQGHGRAKALSQNPPPPADSARPARKRAAVAARRGFRARSRSSHTGGGYWALVVVDSPTGLGCRQGRACSPFSAPSSCSVSSTACRPGTHRPPPPASAIGVWERGPLARRPSRPARQHALAPAGPAAGPTHPGVPRLDAEGPCAGRGEPRGRTSRIEEELREMAELSLARTTSRRILGSWRTSCTCSTATGPTTSCTWRRASRRFPQSHRHAIAGRSSEGAARGGGSSGPPVYWDRSVASAASAPPRRTSSSRRSRRSRDPGP